MYNLVYKLSRFLRALSAPIRVKIRVKRKNGTQECRKFKGSGMRSGWDSNSIFGVFGMILDYIFFL